MSEKLIAAQLKEELFLNRKNGALVIDEEEIKKADDFCEGYKAYLDTGKTERECVTEAVNIAEKKGYVNLEKIIKENKKLKAGDKVYAVNMKKSILLFL